jgi:hypothetical protein
MTSSTEKEFAAWDDVLEFRPNCPYCSKPIQHRGDNLSYRHQSIEGYTMKDNTLSYNCILNLKDKKITEYKYTDSQAIASGGVGPNGTLYISVVFQCTACNEYQFVLKTKLDLTNNLISSFSLSSETFLFTNKASPDYLYNVKVIYPYNEIEVGQVTKAEGRPVVGSRFVVPLFNINILDRDEAIKSLGTYATFL